MSSIPSQSPDPDKQAEQAESHLADSLPKPDLSVSFQPVQVPEFPPIRPYQVQNADGEIKELVEEIANDMLRLMEWTKRLEVRQEGLQNQIETVLQAVQENKKLTSVEIDQLRQELLGDRKFMAVRSTFNTILPTIDSLRAMERVMTGQPEDASRNQIRAAISSLTNLIQSLGFSEYQVDIGASFDPFQMECLGYEEGTENQVLQVIRSGYKSGSTIIRPCGVILAQAKQSSKPI